MGFTHLHRVSGDINQDHGVTFRLFNVTSNWIAWHLGDGGSGGVETSLRSSLSGNILCPSCTIARSNHDK